MQLITTTIPNNQINITYIANTNYSLATVLQFTPAILHTHLHYMHGHEDVYDNRSVYLKYCIS